MGENQDKLLQRALDISPYSVGACRDCKQPVVYNPPNEPLCVPCDWGRAIGEDLADDEDSGVGCFPCEQGGVRHQHCVGETCGRGIDSIPATPREVTR